jgi:hypothetical protein
MTGTEHHNNSAPNEESCIRKADTVPDQAVLGDGLSDTTFFIACLTVTHRGKVT